MLSAGKAVGLSAKLLMDAADRVVLGSGKLEEIMAASTDISASTAQLVIASRVKAREGSEAFELLRQASKVRSPGQMLKQYSAYNLILVDFLF